MITRRLFLMCVISSIIISCTSSNGVTDVSIGDGNPIEDNDDEVSDADYDLLFIGNSLTYSNDLPGLVKEEAEKRGIAINTKMLAKSNYAIIDHWNEGGVQDLIKSKKYDFVIIQQGPSSQSEGRDMLFYDGQKYSALCNENDVKLVYFMVWPARAYYHTFSAVIANYRDAAIFNNALLSPVGSVWKQHFDDTGDFSYYTTDQFHPSHLGSQVAAEVIVQSMNLQ